MCIGNGVQFKLGGRDLFFDFLGSIKVVRDKDFSKRGVVR